VITGDLAIKKLILRLVILMLSVYLGGSIISLYASEQHHAPAPAPAPAPPEPPPTAPPQIDTKLGIPQGGMPTPSLGGGGCGGGTTPPSPPAPPPDVPASQPVNKDLAKIQRLKSPQAFPIPNPADRGGPEGPSQLVFAPGEVKTNKKGQAVKGKLNNDETLLTATLNEVVRVVFQGGTYVYIDFLGYVKQGTLKDDTDLRIRLDETKVRFKGGTPVQFGPSGYVRWGVLGGDSTLRARGDKAMVFQDGAKVYFDRYGLVESGKLGEDRRLPCVNRDGKPQPARDFKAGDFVQFDQNGNVILP